MLRCHYLDTLLAFFVHTAADWGLLSSLNSKIFQLDIGHKQFDAVSPDTMLV